MKNTTLDTRPYESKRRSEERAITASYLGHRFFKNAAFHYSLMIPLYLESGLTYPEISFVEACYWVTFCAFQVPTGYFSDRAGALKAITFGTILLSGAFFLYSFASSVYQFASIAFLTGIAQSMCVGADSAFLRGRLTAIDAMDSFRRIESLGWAARNLALAISMIVGSFVASFFGISAVFILSAVAVLLSALLPVLILFFTKDEEVRLQSQQRSTLRLQDVGLVIRKLRTSRLLYVVIIYCWLYGTDMVGPAIFQLLLVSKGIPIQYFGAGFAAVIIIAAASHLFRNRFSSGDRPRTSLILMYFVCIYYLLISTGALVGGVLGLSICGVGLILYGIFRGIYFPILTLWVAEEAPIEIAATANSVVWFISGLFVSFLLPVVITAVGTVGLSPVCFSLLSFTLVLIIFLRIWQRMTTAENEN